MVSHPRTVSCLAQGSCPPPARRCLCTHILLDNGSRFGRQLYKANCHGDPWPLTQRPYLTCTAPTPTYSPSPSLDADGVPPGPRCPLLDVLLASQPGPLAQQPAGPLLLLGALGSLHAALASSSLNTAQREVGQRVGFGWATG